MENISEITQLLVASNEGDKAALDRLIPLVYAQLRRLAHARLRGERADHTWDTNALVHEAYLKLVDVQRIKWQSRVHFFAMASRIMRRILVDYAHRRNAEKREGERQKVELDAALSMPAVYAESVTVLDEALTRLESINPRHSQIVEYRYFGGMTLEEIAEALDLSLATVKRDLRFAQAWLARELRKK